MERERERERERKKAIVMKRRKEIANAIARQNE